MSIESKIQKYDAVKNEWVDVDPQVLSQEVINDHGSYKRVRQYLFGHHPMLGKLHQGWRGNETIVEKDVINPVKRFGVDHQSTLTTYRQSQRGNK